MSGVLIYRIFCKTLFLGVYSDKKRGVIFLPVNIALLSSWILLDAYRVVQQVLLHLLRVDYNFPGESFAFIMHTFITRPESSGLCSTFDYAVCITQYQYKGIQ